VRHEHEVARIEPLVVEGKVVDVAEHGACPQARRLVVLVQELAHVDEERAGVVLALDVAPENLAHGANHDPQHVVVLHDVTDIRVSAPRCSSDGKTAFAHRQRLINVYPQFTEMTQQTKKSASGDEPKDPSSVVCMHRTRV
jgi:hypothetical protein